jgi:hypothetical protein
MAIFMAFQAPEIEVIGLTTIFGNVDTDLATINALHLVNNLSLLNFFICVIFLHQSEKLTMKFVSVRWQVFLRYRLRRVHQSHSRYFHGSH